MKPKDRAKRIGRGLWSILTKDATFYKESYLEGKLLPYDKLPKDRKRQVILGSALSATAALALSFPSAMATSELTDGSNATGIGVIDYNPFGGGSAFVFGKNLINNLFYPGNKLSPEQYNALVFEAAEDLVPQSLARTYRMTFLRPEEKKISDHDGKKGLFGQMRGQEVIKVGSSCLRGTDYDYRFGAYTALTDKQFIVTPGGERPLPKLVFDVRPSHKLVPTNEAIEAINGSLPNIDINGPDCSAFNNGGQIPIKGNNGRFIGYTSGS